MYKHILVATDGSRLSAKAVKAAVRLAKTCNARLAGIYAVQPYPNPVYSEGAAFGPRMSRARYAALAEREGRKVLAGVEIEAQTAGLPYSSLLVTDAQPWKAITRAARAKRCDLIVMASHGRRGLSALLLGSETSKVLAHSKVPVLVCR
ncbi:MAG TPA: universal stress protein [Burkholderiales bacterium]|nr:universal stress protein [Burkholderiales bacterium]